MKKGQQVSMSLSQDGFIDGVTIEDESYTILNGERVPVVRVKWEDGTQTIEQVIDLF